MVRIKLLLPLACALACAGCSMYVPLSLDRTLSVRKADAVRAKLLVLPESDYFKESAAVLGEINGRGRQFLTVTVYADPKIDAFSYSDGSIFISRGMLAVLEDNQHAVLGLLASLSARSIERHDIRMLRHSLINPGELLYILLGGKGLQTLPPQLRDKILPHLSRWGHRTPDPLENLAVLEPLPLDDIYHYEADASGMRLLVSLGVPPSETYKFLEKLVSAQKRYRIEDMPYLNRGGPSLQDRLISAIGCSKVLGKAVAASSAAAAKEATIPVSASDATGG